MVLTLLCLTLLALAGLIVGGGQGLYHGLKDSAGERQRIRINTVLNATAKRGPGLANSLGCVGKRAGAGRRKAQGSGGSRTHKRAWLGVRSMCVSLMRSFLA